MLDIGKELSTLLNSDLGKDIENHVEAVALAALKAMEPIILAAIKAEITSMLGIAL